MKSITIRIDVPDDRHEEIWMAVRRLFQEGEATLELPATGKWTADVIEWKQARRGVLKFQ